MSTNDDQVFSNINKSINLAGQISDLVRFAGDVGKIAIDVADEIALKVVSKLTFVYRIRADYAGLLANAENARGEVEVSSSHARKRQYPSCLFRPCSIPLVVRVGRKSIVFSES